MRNKPPQQPGYKFMVLFMDKFIQADKKFFNVNTMSMKNVMKQVQTYFYEKAFAAKDSLYIKQSNMIEYIHDQVFVSFLTYLMQF